MNDEIRIPPNRRREVRVVLHCQPEVSKAGRVVSRLLHRPQHERGDRTLFWSALHAVDQLLEMLRRERAAARSKAVAKCGDERLELLDLLRVGCFVHSMQRRDTVVLEVRRHGFVGEQHEFLDDAMGDVAFACDDRFDLANL